MLQRLMRHAEIGTTMKYYVTLDADAVADELWGRDWENPGNTLGNNRPTPAQNSEGAPDAATSETPYVACTSDSGGQGSRTLNRLPGT